MSEQENKNDETMEAWTEKTEEQTETKKNDKKEMKNMKKTREEEYEEEYDDDEEEEEEPRKKRKVKKGKKPGFLKRNWKLLVAGVTGFVGGAATTVGVSVGYKKHKDKKMRQQNAAYMNGDYSPLDPNV